jgi:hypothetical protein
LFTDLPYGNSTIVRPCNEVLSLFPDDSFDARDIVGVLELLVLSLEDY